MTTRSNLLTILRLSLPDRDLWPDAALNQWIADALRDLSPLFPRQAWSEIPCVAGQRIYSLGELGGLLGVFALAYPSALEPPRFLYQRPENAAGFYGSPCYALRGDPPTELALGETPRAGERIAIAYHAALLIPTSDLEPFELPPGAIELARLFCRWQALLALETAEAAHPDPQSALAALGESARQAEELYRARKRELAAQSRLPGGYTGPWRMDLRDRVY